jgi:hypothetical protein
VSDDDASTADPAPESPAGGTGADSVPDPRATDHAVGGDQAAENAENESAG